MRERTVITCRQFDDLKSMQEYIDDNSILTQHIVNIESNLSYGIRLWCKFMVPKEVQGYRADAELVNNKIVFKTMEK